MSSIKCKILVCMYVCMFPVFLHAQSTIDSAYCNFQSTQNIINLGLTGGEITDMANSPVSHRLFISVNSPQSVFISDDSANTWYPAFPFDSLSYDCGQRGWGGRASKVQVNSKGWVAVKADPENKNTASVMSFNNGDTNTWYTIADKSIMNGLGYVTGRVRDIALTENYLFTAIGHYIIKSNTSVIVTNDVVDISALISGYIKGSSEIYALSATSSLSGYPVYFSFNGNYLDSTSNLFKYDGTSVYKIQYPAYLNEASVISVHPGQTSGDTIVISGPDTSGLFNRILISKDGGNSWNDISYSTSEIVKCTGFKPIKNWQTDYPLSNGAILYNGGSSVSADMGISWISLNPNNSAIMADQFNPNVIYLGFNRGVKVSSGGFSFSYTLSTNYGLEAIHVNKISVSASKRHSYLATNAGIAYSNSNSLYDTTFSNPYILWEYPYGAYPVILSSGNTNSKATAICLNPYDTMNVIAGIEGFHVSLGGYTGFNSITPSGFNNDSVIIKDIAFVDSSIVIAVTAGRKYNYTNKGDIWRSADKGLTWNKISPSGFNNGNSISVFISASDTIVWIGTGLTEVDFNDPLQQNPGYIWKSDDGGLNWQNIASGPDYTQDTLVQGLPVYDICTHPSNKDTLYIAAGFYNFHSFAASYNGGQSYGYLSDLKRKSICTNVIVDHKVDSIVYFSVEPDIYVFREQNDSLSLLYRGLPGETVPDMQSGSILVGTTTGFFLIDFEPINDIPVAIKECYIDNLSSSVLVFPNPTYGKFSVSLSDSKDKKAKLVVQNMTGSVLYNAEIFLDAHTIEVEWPYNKFSPGTYIVKIEAANRDYYSKLVILKQ